MRLAAAAPAPRGDAAGALPARMSALEPAMNAPEAVALSSAAATRSPSRSPPPSLPEVDIVTTIELHPAPDAGTALEALLEAVGRAERDYAPYAGGCVRLEVCRGMGGVHACGRVPWGGRRRRRPTNHLFSLYRPPSPPAATPSTGCAASQSLAWMAEVGEVESRQVPHVEAQGV